MNNQLQSTGAPRRTVLIVEDDAHVRRTLALFLRWSGEWGVVGETADGASAVALARLLHPCLILLDLWLPDGNALGLVPVFRALNPAPLVVILTADDTETIQQHARMLGVAGYLLKTTPADKLLTTLRAIAFGAPQPPDAD